MEERESGPSSRMQSSQPQAKPRLKHLVLLDAEDWFNLGLQLDLSYAKLNEIRKNFPRDDSSCKREMFQLWLRSSPSASYQKLAQAYQTLGETEIVALIQQKHGKTHNVSIPKHDDALQQVSNHQHLHNQAALQRIATVFRNTFKRMSVLPSEDWPPSIGRHESNFVMIEHGRGTLPGAKEAKQMQRDYVGGRVDRIVGRKKEIRYEDIFDFNAAVENSEDFTYASKHFRMLIDGAPGIGKTVLCRKFCKDWGAGKILQQFSMVWLLHLREERIAKAKTLDDLFQHYDEDLLREVVQHMKKTGGEGNVLVCDGFDELSKQERAQHSLFLDIVYGKVLPNCSVIVTSRPYASLELQQLKTITHHVEIVGFTDEQIKKCITRNITDESKAEELIQKLKSRLDIFSLCYIPLNCSIMIYVYKQEDYQLPKTLTLLYTFYIRNALKRSAKVHFPQYLIATIDLKSLPECIKDLFDSLCKLAYNGLLCDQLGFKPNDLPNNLQDLPGGRGTKPELLGLMSGTKSFEGTGEEVVSYQFTHLTVHEFLAAWYAATRLSPEELSRLYLEKLEDERFRLMLLFLSGITGLQESMYKQIVQQLIPQLPEVSEAINEPEIVIRLRETQIFLAHLIYESQNANLSHILASLLQQNRELELDFEFLDLFQCTVLTYFVSSSNYPWTLLHLKGLNDRQMEVMQQVSCDLACRLSDARRERKTPNKEHLLLLHNDTQELMLDYNSSSYSFYEDISLPKPTSFSCLLNIKQLTRLDLEVEPLYICDSEVDSLSHGSDTTVDSIHDSSSYGSDTIDTQFTTAWKTSLATLFKALAHNNTLKKLVINNPEMSPYVLDNDSELEKPLGDMLKTNTSLSYLMLNGLGLTDLSATHIAAGLVDNHSLEWLYIDRNKITSVGAVSIFKALENNKKLKILDMWWNKLLCRLHSPHSSLKKLRPVLPLPALPTQATTSHSTSLSPLDQPSPSPVINHDECVGSAIAGMLHSNTTLTELDVSHCYFTPKCSMALFKALHYNSSLESLSIRDNALDTDALADMLSHNHSLTELTCDTLPIPRTLARGLLHNTTLTEVFFITDYDRLYKNSIIAALVELRRQEGYTEQPDPVVSRWEKVIWPSTD